MRKRRRTRRNRKRKRRGRSRGRRRSSWEGGDKTGKRVSKLVWSVRLSTLTLT